MSNEVALTDEPTRLTLRPVETGIWDPAAFELCERVATMMSGSGLLPLSLTHVSEGTGTNKKDVPLPPDVVFARAVLIANQAKHLDVDPLLFAQCCSIVHGRLMYEGKLVHAIIEKRLGVRLMYEFGLWDTDHFVSVGSDEALWGANERIAVRVSGSLSGEAAPRTIEGSAGQWKTSSTNSPWSPGTYRRMLRYRGAREWARAHAPGIMLGIVTDDEADEIQAFEPRLPAPAMALHSEFSDGPAPGPQLDLEPKDDPKPRARRQRGSNSEEASRGGSPAKSPVKAEPLVGEILEGDDLPESLRPTPMDIAPAAEPEPDMSDAAIAASGDGPEASSGPQASSEAPSDGAPEIMVTPGYPAADEIYHLTQDQWEYDPKMGAWRCDTFKNGEPFSSAAPGAEYAFYEDHAPDIAAEPEDDLDKYAGEVESARSWLQVKQAMAWYFQSPHFAKLQPERQAAVRAMTWEFAEKLADVDDQARSPTAFRLWIEAQPDREAIRGTLDVLEHSPAFEALQPSQKDGIRRAVAGRIERLP